MNAQASDQVHLSFRFRFRGLSYTALIIEMYGAARLEFQIPPDKFRGDKIIAFDEPEEMIVTTQFPVPSEARRGYCSGIHSSV